jgi:N-methylhydantoinase A/oxoprolinase/acetone carboxylase beta subunit
MTSVSCEVDPAFREYERTCVTAFDAYAKPLVNRYLENMERDLASSAVRAPLQIMQSRGGIASSNVARKRPVRLFLSGPAAGVIGGRTVGRSIGIEDVITVDIGGTSSDIALISRGKAMIAGEGVIDTFPVRVPMVDVNAIGAGGGSIAWIDAAGSLKVGPHSAGSEPGPACYGRGGEQPTVTDASVVLGYLDPDYFAGGMLKLQPELARAAIEKHIAQPLGMSVEQAALGIHRVVNANMAEGIRLVSVGRGIDPRQFALLPLGGGGAVHANALARELGMRRIIVPLHPGVLSATGLLEAPVEHEASMAFPQRLADTDRSVLRDAYTRLDAQCRELMAAEGIEPEQVRISYYADVCYIGQSYHLEIPVNTDASDPMAKLYADFLEAHDRIYGHSTDAPAKLVNLRAIHQATVAMPIEERDYAPNGRRPLKSERKILAGTGSGYITAKVYERHALPLGTLVEGPAIIEQSDTTIVVEPGWRAEVGKDGNLLITVI